MKLLGSKSPLVRSTIENRELLRIAASAPMLEKNHELDLARRWRDHRETAALAELTRSYLRLAVSMANRFRNYGLSTQDLVQEGCVGLMEAAARFDHERDIRFSTYATWWIRSAMQDYILRNWSIVRTGTTAAHKSLFFNLRRLKAQIASDHHEVDGDAPMSLEARRTLATKLGVRLKDVEIMEARMTGSDRSLNMVVSTEGDAEIQDFLTCDAPRPDELIESRNLAEVSTTLVQDALQKLTPRERIVITARKLSEGAVTLASLGAKLGISKERVRQIENQALAKLKAALLARVSDPVLAGLVAIRHS
jgi:RNA polymerase sigma-32 factor